MEAKRNASATANLHEQYPAYDFIILMASRITPEKNIEMACQAAREVAKKFPRTLLLVVGDGPERGLLEKKYGGGDMPQVSFDDGMEERAFSGPTVIFKDAVPYSTLLSYYKTADMFLVTSNYEGYGRTILESLASGTPVFSTDVGIAREAIHIGENGRVFSVGDKKMLTEGLMKVFYEFENYNLMKFRTRSRAKEGAYPSKSAYLDAFKEQLL